MNPSNPLERMAPWLEQAWMDRYLGRQLADDEIAWFEAYLLDKPDLQDRWATELALRDGMELVERNARESGTVLPASAAPARPDAVSHGRTLAPRRRQWHVTALAASVAMAFGAGFLLNSGMHTDQGDALIADPTRVVIDSSRGGESAPSVDHASSASEFVLVDALVPADATYVAVRGPGMAERKLSVSKDGVATLLLRRSEIGRIGPLTLVVRSQGHEVEKPLQLKQTLTERSP